MRGQRFIAVASFKRPLLCVAEATPGAAPRVDYELTLAKWNTCSARVLR
jgi:hypothetical protein